jgi:cytosine/adenosine deaminase-related metal-dependent hydrolase
VRKIAAAYIFTGNQPPIKNGILTVDDDGTILEIDSQKYLTEQHGLEYYSGILVPGFVNTHCHLELSQLEGKIEEKTGISGFVGQINQLRNLDFGDPEKIMHLADRKMWAAGISVVGDISNSALSVETKLKSRIFYHTFIESFGFHPSRADKAFDYALFVQQQFASQNLKCSVVPHSPYSVSQPLFEKIAQNAVEVNSIVCMHNQESEGEAEFFTNGTGAIATHISETLGIDTSHWNPTGQSSLVSVLKYLPAENPLLLVHNTFTTQADIDVLLQQRALENTFFVLCPNSNLYIENQLPPVELFRQNNLNICLGTDSLASNHQLSVLAEMIILQGNFPDIQLEELVNWACFNGAKALQVANRFGSFEPGRKPGVNLISGIDFKNMKLTEKSKVKRLV